MTRYIAYGGGVQSTAMCVLAVAGRIDADYALFANVGDRAEHPATLAYVRDVFVPWATDRGLTIHEVRRRETPTKRADLWDTMIDYPGDRATLPIPVRAPSGAPSSRSCTTDWKVGAMRRWCVDHDDAEAVSLLGISVDEIERARVRPLVAYPLLELGLTRADCARVIRDAGLPVPPKSACFFCPFHRPLVWREMRRDEPDLFDRAQQLEDVLNERQTRLGLPAVYLTASGRRLSDAIVEAGPTLFDAGIGESGCDEGVCFV